MATMGLKNGKWGPLSLNRVFDSCTPSMRKVDDGEKNGKKNGAGWDNDGNSCPLPVDRLNRN